MLEQPEMLFAPEQVITPDDLFGGRKIQTRELGLGKAASEVVLEKLPCLAPAIVFAIGYALVPQTVARANEFIGSTGDPSSSWATWIDQLLKHLPLKESAIGTTVGGAFSYFWQKFRGVAVPGQSADGTSIEIKGIRPSTSNECLGNALEGALTGFGLVNGFHLLNKADTVTLIGASSLLYLFKSGIRLPFDTDCWPQRIRSFGRFPNNIRFPWLKG